MILTVFLVVAAANGVGTVDSGGEPTVQPTCSKPDFIESPNVTATAMNAQLQQAQVYIDCMSKAINVQRALAEQALQTAKVAADKTNRMVGDTNEFVAKAKAYQADHSGN